MGVSDSRGQTLIEAVVAIAIIGIALVGFLSQSTYNFLASTESLKRNTGLNLAREGIEAVRNIRDSNWLAGCPDPDEPNCYYWHTGLSQNLEYRAIPFFQSAAGEWKLIFVNKTFDDCVQSQACVLFVNDLGLYTADPTGAVASDYYRQVEIRPICQNENACGGDGICESGELCPGEQIGVKVISHVRWKQKDDWRNVVLSDYLYNWR